MSNQKQNDSQSPARSPEECGVSGAVLRVVNFSGGLCSFWAAHRVVQKYGKENVVLLFADTLIEDDDLYAFNEQAAQILGIPITRLSVGLTPWELFRKEGLIGNSRFPICSVRLKREPLNEWQAANCKDQIEVLQDAFWDDGRPPGVLYVGFDWTEEIRVADLRGERSHGKERRRKNNHESGKRTCRKHFNQFGRRPPAHLTAYLL